MPLTAAAPNVERRSFSPGRGVGVGDRLPGDRGPGLLGSLSSTCSCPFACSRGPGGILAAALLANDTLSIDYRVVVQAVEELEESHATIKLVELVPPMSLPEWLPIDESVPHQLLTLVFPVRQGHVLLGMKRRGFGSGLYNGFGGKVHADETVVQGAARELLEEACITSADLIYAGKLFFAFETQPRLMEVFVFLCEQWTGEPHITDEMQPEWFALDGVPFDRMWPDDVLWLDALLRTKAPVLGRVDFALPEEGARTEDGRLRRCSFLDAGDARTSVAALGVTREAHAQSFGTTPVSVLPPDPSI